MGGFLPNQKGTEILTDLSFRPLARYGWVPTLLTDEVDFANMEFPSPLEGWVGSYNARQVKSARKLYLFPSPLEVWGGSY